MHDAPADQGMDAQLAQQEPGLPDNRMPAVAAQGQHQLLAQVEAQGQQHAGRGRTADERRGVIQRLP